jgi:hypothetical protein
LRIYNSGRIKGVAFAAPFSNDRSFDREGASSDVLIQGAGVMIQFLLVTGSSYLMYRWGFRQLILSRVMKNRNLDRIAYLLFVSAGCTLSLYASIQLLFPYVPEWSVPLKSLFPAIAGIGLGEFFYARNLSVASRIIKRLRNKGGQPHE